MHLNELISKFHGVFESGLGLFTGGLATIRLKNPNVIPKFVKARPIPFALKDKIEVELSRLLKLGVIEPVNFSAWATPIVPVIKKNGDVRICGDFKITANKEIVIDKHPLPRIEELFNNLQGGIEFTKLDLSQRFPTFFEGGPLAPPYHDPRTPKNICNTYSQL